jgi:hypothetical protein
MLTKKVLMTSFIFFSITAAGLAQQASIVGTVTDQSGAVIPNARITVRNPQRGITRHLVSNTAGRYVAGSLPIGTYMVTAEAPGFTKLITTEIVLQVGATRRVDMHMKVGQVSQAVQVREQIAHVQTETAQVSDVITGKQMANLELNGRDFVNLMLLVPGASPDNSLDLTNPQNGSDITVSVNGGRHRMNNFMINNMPSMDEGGYGGLNVTPSLDSIQEFRVVTSTYGAEYGKLGAAQINVATKAGTRQFHGDAYDYVRNDAFDANPFFQNRQIAPPGGNAPKTPLKWNDFGYTFGGPFFIPHHYNTDKSKTFFFWSQEWHRYNGAQVINAPVPSTAERLGDFSECDPASGSYNPIIASGCSLPALNGVSYDTVQQAPGFNQQAYTNGAVLMNAMVPLPNNGPINYVHSSPANTDWQQEMIRVDQNFTDKTTAYVSYIHEYETVLTPTGNGGGDTYDTIMERNPGSGDVGNINLTHIFTPSVVTTVNLGISSNWGRDFDIPGPNNVLHSIDRPSNFVENHFFAANNSNPFLPAVTVSGGVPFSFTMSSGPFPRESASPVYVAQDDSTWVLGKHALKFGAYFEKYEKNEPLESAIEAQGNLQFNAGGPITTGNGLADMFLGRIQQYTEAEVQSFATGTGVPIGGYGRGYWRMTQFEPYFEDDWKVTPRLVLTLGLRYSYFIPQHDIQKPPIDDSFIPSLYNPALQAQLDSNDNLIPGSGFNYTEYGNGLVNCGRNGIPRGCTNLREANFAPRFGFAYDPFGHGTTVIRGGYGMFYSATSESMAEGMGGNPPSALTPSGFNILGYDNIVPGALPPFSALLTIPLHETMPNTQQWSLGVQHAFSGNDLLKVSYVGSVGHNLTSISNLNQIPDGVGIESAPGLAGQGIPGCDALGNCDVQSVLINNYDPSDYFVPYRGYTSIAYNPLNANSNYNSLQVEFRHTLSHGLTFQSAYTWSHELDWTSGDGTSSGVDDSNLRRWYANGRNNRAQMLVFNYVYDLPFFLHSTNAFAHQALGGWIFSGITTFYSGAPLTTYGVCGINGFSSGIGEGVQCNSAGPIRPQQTVFNDPQFGPTVQWFNPNNVTEPTQAQLAANGEPGMFGYMGRNALNGPGLANWDMALLKDFSTPWFSGEHSTLQFRFETFNTFNTPEWNGINFSCSGAPNNDGSPAFGRPCGGTVYNLGNGEVNSTKPGRVIQFALKLIF